MNPLSAGQSTGCGLALNRYRTRTHWRLARATYTTFIIKTLGARASEVATEEPYTPKMGPGGATAGDDRKMNDEPLERGPIDRMRARFESVQNTNALASRARHLHDLHHQNARCEGVRSGNRRTIHS